MGVVPSPPPPGLSREELIEYRDHLIRQQAQLPSLGTEVFWFLILVGLVVCGMIAIWPYMEI